MQTPSNATNATDISAEIMASINEGRPVNPFWAEDYSRPGISLETLKSESICPVPAEVAKDFTGMAEPGHLFPYPDPTNDYKPLLLKKDGEERPYTVLRRDNPPKSGHKYHYPAGSEVQIYGPRKCKALLKPDCTLTIVEGQAKALALCEQGIPAVGISGFYGFARKGEKALHPTLVFLLDQYNVKRVEFLGDTDTATNSQFPDAAVKLRELLPEHIELVLPRISYDCPKGIDDCIEAKGAEFLPWWNGLVEDAMEVGHKTRKGELALELLQREVEFLPKEGEESRRIQRRVAKMGAFCCDPSEQAALKEIAVKHLGVGKGDFQKMMDHARKEAAAECNAVDETDCKAVAINLGAQTDVWTNAVVDALKGKLYTLAGGLNVIEDGQLVPVDGPAKLVKYTDSPEVAKFVFEGKRSTTGAKLTAWEAKLLFEACIMKRHEFPEIKTVSRHPVLAYKHLPKPGDESTYLVDHGELRDGIYVMESKKKGSHSVKDGLYKLDVPLAKEILLKPFQDFRFETEADLQRAVAAPITLALCQGGFLVGERAPLLFISKPKVGTGSGILVKMMFKIFGIKEKPIQDHSKQGISEGIGDWALGGEPATYIDNLEGNALEKNSHLASIITEPVTNARVPYILGEANMSRRLLLITSNGATISPDLASRTIEIRILPQDASYEWTDWEGYGRGPGALLSYVEERQELYLGVIYFLIREWFRRGCPGSLTTGFRFNRWELIISGILTMLFGECKLMEGMAERRKLLSNKHVDFVRRLCSTISRDVLYRGRDLAATELAEVSVDYGLAPDRSDDREGAIQKERSRIGKIFRANFPGDGEYPFDDKRLVVIRSHRWSETKNEVAVYRIESRSDDQLFNACRPRSMGLPEPVIVDGELPGPAILAIKHPLPVE